MNKKYIKILSISFITIVIILAAGLNKYELSDGWTYIKYDGKLYVANSGESRDCIIKEQAGCVESKVFKIVKPIKDAESNGFPKGTKLYLSEVQGELIAKYGDKYYPLCDIDTAEGWGNGMKIRIKKDTVLYE